MADVTKTVDIVFGGNAAALSGVIDSVGGDMGRLGSQITGFTAPLDKVTNTVLALDAALVALTLGGMALAVRSAGEFGGKIGEITTLIGDTGAPIDAFKNSIIDYSSTSVKSIDDINQAIYSAISAGVDYKDSLDFVKEAERLSVAGRADLGATTVALISTLNAYGESTDQAGKYSDIMFTTVRLGQTTMEALSTQLAKVTGLAANAGVPFETLSAAVAALTVSGLPTEQALTGIKAALTNIIKPTSDAEEMAQKLGLQFNASALQTKGFEGVLWDAWKATGGNTEQMAKLFGSVEALNAVLILASDKTGKFQNALGEMQKTSGATEAAYNKVADSFENVNQRLANTLEATLITIGEQLTPQYSNLANSIGSIFAGIKVSVDQGAFDPLFDFIDEVGTDAAEKLRLIAKNLPEAMEDLDFSGLIDSLGNLGGALGEAFAAIFGEIDLTTPEGLHEVMQRIIDGMAALTNVTKGVVDGMKPLFTLIGEGIDRFSEMDDETTALIGNVLGLAKSINILADYSGILTGALGLLSLTGVSRLIVDLGKLGGVLTTSALGMNTFILSLGPIAGPAVLSAIAAGIGYMTGSFINQIPVVGQAAQSLLELVDVNGDYFGATGRTKDQMDEVNRKFDEAVQKHKDMGAGVKDTTDATTAFSGQIEKQGTVLVQTGDTIDTVAARIRAMTVDLKAVPEEKTVSIEVVADDDSVEITRDVIMKTFPDGQLLITNIGTKAREDMLSETKKKIDEAVPAQKQMEIQATIDVAKIEAAAEIVQSSIEWKAKLDIADVEANAKIIEAAFKSIDNTITSAGTTLTGMLGTWAQVMSAQMGGTSFIEQQIREENARRDRALDMQEKLTIAEVDNIKARTDAIKRGDAMIQIDGAGLQPHLEAFMFEILAAIQVRANAEGQKFLVGV